MENGTDQMGVTQVIKKWVYLNQVAALNVWNIWVVHLAKLPELVKVIERMKNEDPPKIRTVRGKTEFLDGNNKWRPLSEADMAHKTDAVTWWNEVGRKYGPKSKEVRDWMRDPDNYYLEHYSKTVLRVLV